MDLQDVTNLVIPEGEVKAIHDSYNRLLWGRLNYNTTYCGNTTQQTYTGKNLLSLTGEAGSGVTGTMNQDGTFTITGKATITDGVRLGINTDVSLPPGTYTFTIGEARASVTNLVVSSNNTNTSMRINAGNTSATATIAYTATKIALFIAVTNGVTYNETFSLQLVSGSTPDYDFEPYVGGVPSPNPNYPQDMNVVTGEQIITISDGQTVTDFTVNLGSIELCKIGNYQDYIYKSGDDWYIKKTTSKYMFTGNETVGKSGNASNNSYYYASSQNPDYGFSDIDKTNMTSGDSSSVVIPAYCQYFVASSSGTVTGSDSIGLSFNLSGSNGLDCRFGVGLTSTINTAALFKTWLGENSPTVYYPLAAPTDTKITDATLVEQLNAVNEWLTRYGYNSTITGNLPLIINRTNL